MSAAAIEQALVDLHERGWAVVPGVMSPEACARAQDELWKTIEAVTLGRVQRAKPATWSNPAKGGLRTLHGIVQEPESLYHCKAVWEVRAAAAPAFARLYGDDDLATSMDRLCIYPAPDPANGIRVARAGPWLHTDQSPLREGLACVQGFVDLLGTGELDGGLVVVDRSHKAHQSLLLDEFKVKGDIAKDWYKFTDEEAAVISTRFKTIKVTCPPGSAVIWDSRTFHQNTPPSLGGHARLVVYVCMQPWALIKDAQLRDKARADKLILYAKMRGTSHWPLNNTPFGPTRTYGAEPLEYLPGLPIWARQPDLDLAANALVARLVGYVTMPAADRRRIGESKRLVISQPAHMIGRITKTSVKKGVPHASMRPRGKKTPRPESAEALPQQPTKRARFE
jgi:hypothetical protein